MTSRQLRVLALPALLIGAVCTVAARDQDTERFEGEYGLWVEARRDSVVVHWLTEAVVPGVASIASPDGRVRVLLETPASVKHRVAIPRPRVSQLQLVYGSQASRTATLVDLTPRSRRFEARGVDSLYILGDTHGEFDAVVGQLRRAGLIDSRLRWAGGKKHLVFDGDLMDRGPDVVRLLWFVYGLEREAAAAGGRVHLMLGNHEIMVLLSDLRYLHPKDRKVADLHGVKYSKMYDIRESVLGQWLASKSAVARIDDVLLAHGGVSDRYLNFSLKAIDDTLSKYMREDLFYRWADSTAVIRMDSTSYTRREHFFWHPASVFWFRGYLNSDSTGPMLDRVLDHFDAKLHVIGHTPQTGIHSRYGGKLIAAHPRRPGGELLLLVRERDGYRRLKWNDAGELVPVPAR